MWGRRKKDREERGVGRRPRASWRSPSPSPACRRARVHPPPPLRGYRTRGGEGRNLGFHGEKGANRVFVPTKVTEDRPIKMDGHDLMRAADSRWAKNWPVRMERLGCLGGLVVGMWAASPTRRAQGTAGQFSALRKRHWAVSTA
jgi:hypothetical protein